MRIRDDLYFLMLTFQGKDLLAKMGVMTQATAKEINGGSQLDFVPSTLIDGVCILPNKFLMKYALTERLVKE